MHDELLYQLALTLVPQVGDVHRDVVDPLDAGQRAVAEVLPAGVDAAELSEQHDPQCRA